MASRSSTVIISSSPIAKVGGLLTLTIAEINGTWLPFSLADGPLAPKYDSHPFGDWPPNLVITRGSTGSLLYYTKQQEDLTPVSQKISACKASLEARSVFVPKNPVIDVGDDPMLQAM